MPVALRPLARGAVLFVAIVYTGCSPESVRSNNEGRIAGKWKIVSTPAHCAEFFKQLSEQKFYYSVEFATDGRVVFAPAWDDPTRQGHIDESGQDFKLGCAYKLLNGEDVEFSGLGKDFRDKTGGLFGTDADRVRVAVKIADDRMTVTNPEGKTGTLTRAK